MKLTIEELCNCGAPVEGDPGYCGNCGLPLSKDAIVKEPDLSQELQSLGMDYDVLVQYIRELENIIRSSSYADKIKWMIEIQEEFIDRYGNINGINKEEV